LIKLDAEQKLYQAFNAIKVVAGELVAKKDFNGALDALKKLSAPIDLFFDSVMVMDENLEIRNNRLALLKSIDNFFAEIADFSKIVL
jgi:glycyl-tRNA synthetase beta chain